MESKKLSRRAFLSRAAALAGMAALGSLAAACGATPTPQVIEKVVTQVVQKEVTKIVAGTPVTVKETVVVEKPVEKVVTQVVEKPAGGEVVVPFITQLWWWQKVGWQNATDRYNMDNRGKVRIQVDTAPDGFETKVREMITRNALMWDGQMRVRNRQDAYQWYSMGIMQAVEPYIKTSTVPWAKTFFDDLLPVSRAHFTIEGKLWYMSADTEVNAHIYYVDEWKKVIGGNMAETLDERNRQLLELKKAYPDKVPLGIPQNLYEEYQELMQLWTSDIWVKEGNMWLPNYRSEAYKEYLNLLKFWYDNRIITDDTWGPGALWEKRQCLTSIQNTAWAFALPRQVYGRDAIDCDFLPVLKKGSPPKTFFKTNALSLFVGAKYPQQVVDWWLSVLDPYGDKYADNAAILDYYHLPVFKPAFDNVVKKTKKAEWNFVDKTWPAVQNSVAEPVDSYPIMISQIANPVETKYVKGQIKMDEVVQTLLKVVPEQLQKQMVQVPK